MDAAVSPAPITLQKVHLLAKGAGDRDSRDGPVLGETTAMVSAQGWGRDGGGSSLSPSPATGTFHSSPGSQNFSPLAGPSGGEKPGASPVPA